MSKGLFSFVAVLLLPSLIFSQTFDEFKQQQLNTKQNDMKQFELYKNSVDDEFNNYVKKLDEAYEDYKKEIGAYWEDEKLSSKKDWVAYTKDKKTRTIVSFDTDTITVQTIANSKQEAQNYLKKALAKVVVEDTKTAFETDELSQKIAKIESKSPLSVSKKIDKTPLLAPIIFQKPPTKKQVVRYINKHISPTKIVSKPSKIADAKVYSVKVSLPSSTTLKRSKLFESKVSKNAKRFSLSMPLVFAIMHTESYFNPFAKSHVPAYGLMQIVPRTAGIDSYNFLYHRKKMPTAQYLYNSTNNIEMGSAYLHILYYKYLKKIKNPTSRLYCTIAAYNTGAGNVSYAFSKNHNINDASKIINTMTPQEVYNHLVRNLKYDEAKHYVQKVTDKMAMYRRVYKTI